MVKGHIMITVEAIGGKKKEKEIASEVVFWCVKKLMPRLQNLDVEVHIKNTKELEGYCVQCDDREYEIGIRRGLSLYDLIATICHEMVHVKQYVRKEMDQGYRWKTRKVLEHTDYMDLPWEKEAFRLEQQLATECFKELKVSL